MENPKIRFKGFTKDWEQRKFGSLLEETRNKTIFEDEDTLLSCAIDGMYLNSELFSHFRGSSNIGYLKVKKNDLILSAQNLHLGNCNVNLRFEHGIISPAYKVYELVGCNPLFMQAWVKKDSTKDFFLKSSTEGASVCRKNIVWEELYKQELPVPSIEEQTKVGEYFYSLDNLITLHQRKCEQTKKLKKYMLQKMFPQNGAKVPEIRFDGFTYDWEQRKLSELLEKYEDPVETPHDGYERVGIRSHAKGTFHSFVEPGKELDTAKMYRVAADKFILNITFAWEHAVAITDNNDAGKLVSHRFPQFSFNPKLKPHFFKYLMLDKKFREHLELSSPGGAGRNRVLKISDMLKYEIKLPSIEEQIKIGKYFDNLDHLITLHQRKCDELKKMKKYMLQNMFI